VVLRLAMQQRHRSAPRTTADRQAALCLQECDGPSDELAPRQSSVGCCSAWRRSRATSTTRKRCWKSSRASTGANQPQPASRPDRDRPPRAAHRRPRHHRADPDRRPTRATLDRHQPANPADQHARAIAAGPDRYRYARVGRIARPTTLAPPTRLACPDPASWRAIKAEAMRSQRATRPQPAPTGPPFVARPLAVRSPTPHGLTPSFVPHPQMPTRNCVTMPKLSFARQA
jgi:hypothetical protein